MNAQRRLIVGVIGGDDNMPRGEELGREIARRGWILLTGGQVLERSIVEPVGAVKDAAMLGADAAESESDANVTARLVGIIPSNTVRWRRPSARRLFLDTGLSHNVRNVITGRTPDIVIAFGGSQGTLAEVAFAKAAGREVIFYVGLDRLRRNFGKYFGKGSASIHRETYFEEALRTYPIASGTVGTVSGLISLLEQTLADSIEADCTAAVLADRIEATSRPNGWTDFPELPGDPESKGKFVAALKALVL